MHDHPYCRAWIAPTLALTLVGTILAALIAVPTPGYALPQETGTPLPTPTYPFHGTYTPPAQTPVFDVPPAVPMLDVDNDALVNVLLLGSDSFDLYLRRTDVIILVSIHKDTGTVAMWHMPRALFVYIPNHTLDLLNTVYARGEAGNPGGGFKLLRETFRYNFGVELDYFARVNFEGFMEIIKHMGGLWVSVDCALQDWRLKDPELDPTDPDNWEEYLLPVGRYQLSPYMALWYARSRKTTSDLDRGRRQMDLLRAMWVQMKESGMLVRVDELWPWVEGWVDTNMTLEDALALIPVGLRLDPAQIARYGGAIGTHYMTVYTPDDGREVLLPQREYLIPMVRDVLTPSTANRLGRATTTIEVVDATWWNMGLHHVAADRLAWDGFAAQVSPDLGSVRREATVIYDYTGQSKASPLPELMRLLRVNPEHVVRQPDPNRAVDFRVEIGQAYNACVYGNAEQEADAAPAAEYLPEDLREAVCWLRFSAEVNVRSGPGITYPVLDTADPNDVLPVTGRDAAGAWWRVDADGQAGWISSEITTASATGQCDTVPVVAPDTLP